MASNTKVSRRKSSINRGGLVPVSKKITLTRTTTVFFIPLFYDVYLYPYGSILSLLSGINILLNIWIDI